ncbi:cobalamin biosynthesis protein CobG [Actinacidiphila glaucinigra]|uniref:cobalamin biosynthesis protein CobG n=1 Tax=Actinacidiphila glaucinigra TaxID=235986 RepID=UPI003D8BD53C
MPSPSDPPVSGAFAAATAGRGRDDACPGALRLHAADDGALARIRVPGGLLTIRQAEAAATAADRLGDGRIDLTSRGNLQVRGLRDPGAGTELAALLGEAGLLPSWAHERARNLVASPLAGLDGRGHGDLRGLIRDMDALLCASPAAAGLSGRFLFALDDGRGDTAALGADVTLTARPGGATAELRLAGRPVALVPAADAPRWAVRAAEAFLTLAAERGARAWRIADIDPDGTAIAALLRAEGAPPAGPRTPPPAARPRSASFPTPTEPPARCPWAYAWAGSPPGPGGCSRGSPEPAPGSCGSPLARCRPAGPAARRRVGGAGPPGRGRPPDRRGVPVARRDRLRGTPGMRQVAGGRPRRRRGRTARRRPRAGAPPAARALLRL